MEKVALIYSFNTKKTANVAKKIEEAFGAENIQKLNAEEITEDDFLKNKYYILGVPTWFDGELPNYWDEFRPALEEMNLKGKKFAIFGLGDQKEYPENFLDAIGLMAKILENQGGKVIGFTSTEGYTYESSAAETEDGKQFVGLGIDTENQSKLTKQRIEDWVKGLKKEFK